MRFGQSLEDFNKNSGEGGSSQFIRALKEGDTVVHFLAESRDWVGYYEHYNPTPGGFSFPCTQEDSCPGCNSDLEKMKSRGRKVAFPALVDDKWVNIYKVPKKFADRLEKRGERWETLMDREYILNRRGLDTDTDYDVETGDKDRVPFDASAFNVPDIEKMLMDQFKQAWPEWEEPKAAAPRKQAKPKEQPKDKEFTEAQLRAMEPKELIALLEEEGTAVPKNLTDTDDIVDHLMEKAPY